MDIEELKIKLLSLVNGNNETVDVEFKKELRFTEPKDKAEFIRDVLSLANPLDRSNREVA